MIALRQRDEDSTTRLRQYLEDLDGPFLYGAPWLWLARTEVAARNPDRAVSHLRRAPVDGLPFQISIHTWPEFAALHDHPGFKGVLSAKG